MTNRLHVIVPRSGHGGGGKCTDDLIRDFTDRVFVQGLDPSCAATVYGPTKFMTAVAGGKGYGAGALHSPGKPTWRSRAAVPSASLIFRSNSSLCSATSRLVPERRRSMVPLPCCLAWARPMMPSVRSQISRLEFSASGPGTGTSPSQCADLQRDLGVRSWWRSLPD